MTMASSTTCTRQLIAISIVVVVLWSLMVASSAQQFYPNGRYGKREERAIEVRDASFKFYPGSRFGRRDAPSDIKLEQRSDKNTNVVQRTDKFFLNSRYGKRNNMDLVNSAELSLASEDNTDVTCLYAGISNVYRCYRKDSANEDRTVN